jgi:hypothetical protein
MKQTTLYSGSCWMQRTTSVSVAGLLDVGTDAPVYLWLACWMLERQPLCIVAGLLDVGTDHNCVPVAGLLDVGTDAPVYLWLACWMLERPTTVYCGWLAGCWNGPPRCTCGWPAGCWNGPPLCTCGWRPASWMLEQTTPVYLLLACWMLEWTTSLYLWLACWMLERTTPVYLLMACSMLERTASLYLWLACWMLERTTHVYLWLACWMLERTILVVSASTLVASSAAEPTVLPIFSTAWPAFRKTVLIPHRFRHIIQIWTLLKTLALRQINGTQKVPYLSKLSQAQSKQSAKLFFQWSEYWLPHSLTRRRVCTPLPLGWHTHLRERGWGSPNSDEGRDTVVL